MQAKKSPEQTGQVNHARELSPGSAAEEAKRKGALVAALAEREWIAVELPNGDFAFRRSDWSHKRGRRRARGLAGLELVVQVICGPDVLRAAGGTPR
jgi:hypothetical protein